MAETPNLPARPQLPTESTQQVTLREFEQRVFALQQQFNDQLRFLRELVETKELALQKALELQALEIARRLEELNHAHENTQANWRQSLPREVFDTSNHALQQWREVVNAHLVDTKNVPGSIAALQAKQTTYDAAMNKIIGGFILLGVMGLAGVLGLVLGLLRLAGVVR